MSCHEKKKTKHIQGKPTESSMQGHRTQNLWEANRRKLNPGLEEGRKSVTSFARKDASPQLINSCQCSHQLENK